MDSLSLNLFLQYAYFYKLNTKNDYWILEISIIETSIKLIWKWLRSNFIRGSFIYLLFYSEKISLLLYTNSQIVFFILCWKPGLLLKKLKKSTSFNSSSFHYFSQKSGSWPPNVQFFFSFLWIVRYLINP